MSRLLSEVYQLKIVKPKICWKFYYKRDMTAKIEAIIKSSILSFAQWIESEIHM